MFFKQIHAQGLDLPNLRTALVRNNRQSSGHAIYSARSKKT